MTRARIAEIMNREILLCPATDFLRDYGPAPVEPAEVSACKDLLVDIGILVTSSTEYRWEAYPSNPSDMSVDSEVKVTIFDSMKSIVDAVFGYAGTTERQRCNKYTFELLPYHHVESNTSGINHRMAASMIEDDTGDTLDISQSIVPCEYSIMRDTVHQQQVRQHILGDCHHILSDDLRRMFIYGITIEDTRMGLWYFSRSHSVKAHFFDYVKDIDTFIHVFLAIAYATPNELGVDPLVHKAPLEPNAKATQHYIYELSDESVTRPKFFKTVQVIHDMRPSCITGRITRIWKVIEVDSPTHAHPIGADHVVLKDVWVDTNKATEAENFDSIMAAMDKLISDSQEAWGEAWLDRLLVEDKRFAAFRPLAKAKLKRLLSDSSYKSLFLTKLHAWRGETTKPLSPAALSSPEGVFPVSIDPDDASNPAVLAASTQVGVKIKRKWRRNCIQRQQSRFVYKEVCSQLFEVETLGNVMDLIVQADEALMILFCAGWVHRDISSGNLLAYRENGSWKLKLADLELAQRLEHRNHRADSLAGTPFFMPHEIITPQHLVDLVRGNENMAPGRGFVKQIGLSASSPHYQRLDQFKQTTNYGGRVSSIPDTITSDIPASGDPVRYNFQHDLEALWWIISYYITACVPHQQSRDYAKQMFSQYTTVNQLRVNAFLFPFSTQLGHHIHPIISNVFSKPMETLRCYMIEEYIAREVFGQLDVKESYSVIHNDFVNVLQKIMDDENNDWKDISLVAPSALTGVESSDIRTFSKRECDENDIDYSDNATDVQPPDAKKVKMA